MDSINGQVFFDACCGMREDKRSVAFQRISGKNRLLISRSEIDAPVRLSAAPVSTILSPQHSACAAQHPCMKSARNRHFPTSCPGFPDCLLRGVGRTVRLREVRSRVAWCDGHRESRKGIVHDQRRILRRRQEMAGAGRMTPIGGEMFLAVIGRLPDDPWQSLLVFATG